MKNILFKKKHLSFVSFLLLTLFLLSVTACNQPVVTKPTENLSTLKFDANGGQGTMDQVTGLRDGQKITLPKNSFTNGDKVFIGWTFTKGSDTSDYQDMSPVYTYFPGTSTLYALWADKEEVIKISFNPNGGSGSAESFYVKSGQEISIPPNNFTPPAGKEFFTCTSYGLTARRLF